LVAEILSDVRPVLPFDVRVVVLVIFPEVCRRRDVYACVMIENRPVDELRSIIAVEPAYAKREGSFDALERTQYALLTFPKLLAVRTNSVAISTLLSVKANMPAMDVPQCATVSASRKPECVHPVDWF